MQIKVLLLKIKRKYNTNIQKKCGFEAYKE